MKPLSSFISFFLIGSLVSLGQNIATEKSARANASSSPGFEVLKNHFHQYVDEGTLAGTMMMISKGEALYKDAYGFQDIEHKTPISENTIFRLASMTKPIVTVAAMMLVEEKKLKLNDPVGKFIPSFKNLRVYESENNYIKSHTPLTIKHLMSHTGGVSSEFDSSPVGEICHQAMKKNNPQNLKDLVHTMSKVPLAFQPGEGWAYSYSTDILAYVIETISGQPIDEFLAERIFAPLKMKDTGFQVPTEKMDRFAVLYAPDESDQLMPIDVPAESRYTNGINFPRGNGGLTSTIGDYYRFISCLQNGGELEGKRILEEETVTSMQQNLIPDAHLPIQIAGRDMPGYGFGLGFGVLVGEPPFGKAGDYFWPGAAFTYFFANPNDGTIGLFMTQLSDMRKMHLIGEFHGMANKVFEQSSIKTSNHEKF